MAKIKSFIRFVDAGILSNRTTKVWLIRPADVHRDGVLGVIKWHSGWRRYAFFPAQETLWDSVCLVHIQKFLDKAMADYKLSKVK
jgi:hypothetical protein